MNDQIDSMIGTDHAALFARDAHGGQKYGKQDDPDAPPYTAHLYDVQQIALSVKDPVLHPTFVSDVAWLHDVLEDTDVTRDELAAEFGEWVAGAVELLSDPEGKNRKERKAKLHSILGKLDKTRVDERATLLVKAADRLANVRSCRETGNDGLLGMYRKEQDAFRAAVYRSELTGELMAEIDQLLGLPVPGDAHLPPVSPEAKADLLRRINDD